MESRTEHADNSPLEISFLRVSAVCQIFYSFLLSLKFNTSLKKRTLGVIKCEIHSELRERPETIFHCLHMPECEMWPAPEIGVFMTDQVVCSGGTAAAQRECPP